MSVTMLQVLQGIKLAKAMLDEGIELVGEMMEEGRDLTPEEMTDVQAERDERASDWLARLEAKRDAASGTG